MIENSIPLTVLTEPPAPANVSTLAPKGAQRRSLHAVLVESLNTTQALLARLEAGVSVPRPGGQQREVVRLLYVAARHQRDALAACLELEGLE